MSSPVLLRSSAPWSDDAKYAMTKLEQHCNAILATLTYLKRVCLTRAAQSQLESVQYLLISQHGEMTTSVKLLCQDLYRKQSSQFESQLLAANSSLASLCSSLDRRIHLAVRFGDQFDLEDNSLNDWTRLMADYRETISSIIDACRSPRVETHSRERLRSSLPSELEGLHVAGSESEDENKVNELVDAAGSQLRSTLVFMEPSDSESACAAPANTSRLLRSSSPASSAASSDSSSSSGASSLVANASSTLAIAPNDKGDDEAELNNRSEDSTQTEEEVTEEFVKVDGVLYKRRILRRRRQKVVRTRTVVSSAEPPVVTVAATSAAPDHQESPPPPPLPPRLNKSANNTDEDGTDAGSGVMLRRPETAANDQIRLVTQYMQALGDSSGRSSGGSFDRDDLMTIDFSRHSAIESFDLCRARWRQLLSAAEPDDPEADAPLVNGERTKTVCLVSEQRELQPGLYVQRSATVSRTVRQPQQQAAQQPAASSNESVAAATAAQLPPHCQEDLSDLLVWDNANSTANATNSSTSGDDCILVRGGPLDALLVYACLPGNDRPHILFCESFAATFPCFAKPAELLAKIVERCLHFKTQTNKDTLWKSAFAFLIRVLDESTQQDRENRLNSSSTGSHSASCSPLMEQLAKLKERLLADGNLAEVQILGSALHCLRIQQQQQRDEEENEKANSTLSLSTSLSIKRRNIVEFSPRQVAEQITLMDARLYRRIDIQEYLAFVRARSGEQFVNLQAFINFFNRLGFWAKTLVLGRPADRMRDRQRFMSFFCKVSEELRRHHNFNSHLAIVLCLVSLDRLPWPGRSVRRKLKDFTSKLANQSAFAREYFRNMSTTEPPLVPHVGEVLKYLTRIHEGVIGNDEIRQLPASYPVERARAVGPVINYWKYWMSYNCLDFCIKFKRYSANSMYYEFQSNPEILASIDNFNEALDEQQLAELETTIRHKYSQRPK
ncbi:hypothetical protein BOX15_Mlig001407g4 [Macrostomum lignano]|uniref:Ras-GEF domain-containing protein n=1 Tax=Macrostomum lignano TaxID=282301 RepID=A0A267GFB5_9PLAT|nr:hypothetical protein BOX15_Mlig001407g4 [Macrostomum lignano]